VSVFLKLTQPGNGDPVFVAVEHIQRFHPARVTAGNTEIQLASGQVIGVMENVKEVADFFADVKDVADFFAMRDTVG
jgi:hypothetical protein